MAHILLGVDNFDIKSQAISELSTQHQVETCFNPSRLQRLHKASLDLIIILAGKHLQSWLDQITTLREQNLDTPIMAISPPLPATQAAALFYAGVDSLIYTPYSTLELNARIYALTSRPPRTETDTIMVGDLEINKQKLSARRQQREIRLRQREFNILVLLAQHPEHIFTRHHINLGSKLRPDTDESVVDVHISSLRRALRKLDCAHIIQTIHGVGYRLIPPQ